jgi:two-component system nitrogen regulation response regulator GlnG/two-component system response regulator HydG
VRVKNAGQCRLSRNGVGITEADVAPGDTLELGKQMVLLCVRRPAWLVGQPPAREVAFGGADEHGIVGESPAIWELRGRIASIGPRSGHVFIRGESGSGKELVARALHASSPRAGRPLIARNAATFPEGLIDAELFGNARNYPHAGMPERPGLIGEADGGTLFLDEFAELPVSLQAHLLRVLDSGEYHRLGEARARRSNFRLVAATNRAASALKHDVLARLPFRIETPGLGDRREDIPLLASRLLRGIARDDQEIARRFFETGEGEPVPRVAPSLMSALVRHTYTTHVRELATLLWRSLAGSRGRRIELCAEMGLGGAPPIEEADIERSASTPPRPDGQGDLGAAAIQAALDANNGSIEETWRALGLSSRHALTRLIQKHGVVIRKRAGRR